MRETDPTTARQNPRVLLLGASNVTRSFGTLIATLRAVHHGPIDVLAAHGHGRSYGAWSKVHFRKLPGIVHCGIWEAARTLPPAPTAALVTDIGNDILYEHPVAMIANWVEQCLDRLIELRCKSIVTSLPVENIPKLSAARYKFFRTLFMPRCRLSLSEVAERVFDLNERVRRLTIARGMSFATPNRDWYGLDPLHVRLRAYREAWRTVLSTWVDDDAISPVFSRAKLREAIFLQTRLAQRVQLFGRALEVQQPCARLRDGTTIALY